MISPLKRIRRTGLADMKLFSARYRWPLAKPELLGSVLFDLRSKHWGCKAFACLDRQMGCHFACPSRMSTTITPTSNVVPSTPRTKTWSKTSRTSHYVAIGSGQGHARLNGGRREFIGCSRLHLQTARHWAFGHAKFRGRANQENGRRRHGMSHCESETRETGCSSEDDAAALTLPLVLPEWEETLMQSTKTTNTPIIC